VPSVAQLGPLEGVGGAEPHSRLAKSGSHTFGRGIDHVVFPIFVMFAIMFEASNNNNNKSAIIYILEVLQFHVGTRFHSQELQITS
jgi:hypothetical protein